MVVNDSMILNGLEICESDQEELTALEEYDNGQEEENGPEIGA